MIAERMTERGYTVDVITPWQPGLAMTERQHDVRVHRVRPLATRVAWFARDPNRRHHPPFPDPGTIHAVRRILNDTRPDVVHSYGWITYSAAVAVRLSRHRPTLLVSARDYAHVCAVRNLLFYRGRICEGPSLLKCLGCAAFTYTADQAGNAVLGAQDRPVSNADRVKGAAKGMAAVAAVLGGRPMLRSSLGGLHSVSTFVREVMDRHLLGLDRAPGAEDVIDASGRHIVDAVLPSFLPPGEPGAPDAAMLQRLPDRPYILFVGALLPQKGIWPLLAAYQQLDDPPPLVLIGPTFHNSPSTFPDGVVVLPAVSSPTVMAAWDRALFGVVPSVGAETFGNVITEAMQRGRAVIGSAVGGIGDIIVDGETGLLVAPGDVAALASAMRRLIDDPATARQYGEAGRRRVRIFEADAIVPRFDALYRRLAEAAR
jgi:glycosyltransferase involved in cell wall biosynthesis